MRRLLPILALLLCLGSPVFAAGCGTSITLTGAGCAPAAAGGPYVGPGDVVGSASAWWGLRCYNTAYTGNVADIWDSATGSTTETILTCSAGGTINQTVNTLATTCASGCRVKTLYDQSGSLSCSGAVCDMTQATNANRPTFTQSCIGSLPCMTYASGNNISKAPNTFTLTQPNYSISAVYNATAGPGGAVILNGFTGGAFQAGIYSTATQVQCYAGTGLNVTESLNAWYAVQNVPNGASSVCYINGTSNSGNAGTNAISASDALISGTDSAADNFVGKIVEIGIWGVGFSGAQQSNMNANQRAYWGF